MPKAAFVIKKKTGWKRLDDILEATQNAINERTPLESETIEVGEEPNGIQICVKSATPGGGAGNVAGGGSGGATANLYAALNGAPALYHLSQTAPPTPV